jgi:hypothetical protein
VLSLDAVYYLFFVKNLSTTESWINDFTKILDQAKKNNRMLYIVTPEIVQADRFFNKTHNFNVPVFSLDATSFKTAARTNPELYLLKGPVIKNKWGRVNLKEALKK